ncbi:Alcohol dehydrogenase, zinc-binding protein domain protein [Rubellimicrobium mesophilum DSM 19309]|uniref:histidine kinase n=1 Tax=Rubellimicrobium mesophilum DSM 19309 TaxID=442562 RepID=A0A017HUI1_9RHOB|nr:sensor histidine kinase [Rubellimicrobium mesophilum]EYD77980.1 Alcohol dehydrogenase, zinc-binding protein domain protein [Rubellimicrobium mesophilum DSM 19309]
MQFERRMTVVGSGIFETLDALLDAPFALCSVVTDSEGRPMDYRFLRASGCLEEVLGAGALEGRTARELASHLDNAWVETFGRVALDRTAVRFTQRADATGRDYEVLAAPLDPPGCFAVTFRDVTRSREHAAALDHAQRLLRELGHRVMNSFASISAILAMEARAAPPEGRGALKRVQGRVQALAALYRRLDGAPEMESTEVGGYLAGNVQGFRSAFAADLDIRCDLPPTTLPTRTAVPLALILNEILTDAAAQAVEVGHFGIRVSLHREGDSCRLVVEHGGAAMTEGSVGRSLAAAFAAELGGELASEAIPGGVRTIVAFQV